MNSDFILFEINRYQQLYQMECQLKSFVRESNLWPLIIDPLYLSGLDQMEFKAIVSVRSDQINCITKSTALKILFDLRAQRL
jgi:hypothetical protein